jgi:GDP-L-fucose synthase
MGRDHTVEEYYQAAAEIVGYQGTFVYDLSRPVGLHEKLVDTTRQEALGWAPSVGLREGLELTYRFFLENAQ